jgi:hypothetical protein
VRLSFDRPGANATRSINATVAWSTPSAGHGGYGGSYTAPEILAGLGVRFILWPSPGALPDASILPADEVEYLHGEYGFPVIYSDPEWTVLEVPSSIAPTVPGGSG